MRSGPLGEAGEARQTPAHAAHALVHHNLLPTRTSHPLPHVHRSNPGRVEQAVAAVERAGAGSGGAPPRGFVADLASLAQVRRLAEEVKASSPSIDVLINNAGVFEQQLRKSEVGWCMGWCKGCVWDVYGMCNGQGGSKGMPQVGPPVHLNCPHAGNPGHRSS